MSNNYSIRTSYPNILTKTIGYNTVLDLLERTGIDNSHTKYPPYNLLEIGKNKNQIQIAIAGFDKNDIKVSTDNGYLTVTGEKLGSSVYGEDENDTQEAIFLYQGISRRDFSLSWKLNDHVEVKDVIINNGMLIINLETNLPEPLKPKVFEIK